MTTTETLTETLTEILTDHHQLDPGPMAEGGRGGLREILLERHFFVIKKNRSWGSIEETCTHTVMRIHLMVVNNAWNH